jgi:3-phosphoshikimate 1-carboxyvinyltransferase
MATPAWHDAAMPDVQFSPPTRPFSADATLPGDKSMSHRALLLAAMAHGASPLRGLGPGRDVEATVGALRHLGVTVEPDGVESPGVLGWTVPETTLDAGNSGTTLRLLAGALAGRPFRVALVGDDSLMRRPMRRLVGPLAALGASVTVGDAGTPPVVVQGGALRGASVVLPMASAQVRTAVSLAALQAEGATTVDSPPGFRDHTERWLASLGLGRWVSSTSFRIEPGPVPPVAYNLPGDTSSASYLAAAAALSAGSDVLLRGITLNPGRTGFFDVLEMMGAIVVRAVTGAVHGDPTGDVTVRAASLRGVHIRAPLTVRAMDELPLIAVLAGAASGETEIRDASELAAKESDRIAATVAMVRALGGSAEPRDDGFVVTGLGARYPGGVVDAAGDHRIAMAAAVAATFSESPVTIRGFEAVDVSWPAFREELEGVWSSSR